MKITLKIWLLIIVLALSLLAIRPSFESGVIVKSVNINSQLYEQGLRQGEIVKEINGKEISTIEDYTNVINNLFPTTETIRMDITTKVSSYIIFVNETPEITVSKVPQTKIKTGLDIQGGARALVQPEGDLTDAQLQDLIDVSNNRFNVFGISDVKLRGVTDLSGNKYMLVEVAGATPTDLEELISQQGKFEAKIGDEVVFVGGEDYFYRRLKTSCHKSGGLLHRRSSYHFRPGPVIGNRSR